MDVAEGAKAGNPPPPEMPAPRGTAIQIGNLPGARTVSAKAQLDATAARLRSAEASGDPNEMLAAL